MEEEQQQEQQQTQQAPQQQQAAQTHGRPTFLTKLRSFYIQCVRVFKVTKKPTKLEFQTIVKVSGLGMIAIGLIGFVITMLKQIFFKV